MPAKPNRIRVTRLKLADTNHKMLESINALLVALSPKNPSTMTMRELRRMVRSQTKTFIAWRGDEAIAMASVAVVYQPAGIVCHVEDVATLEVARRSGAAELVMRRLIRSLPKGWRQLDLTSKPERIPAHKLYLKLGFVSRDTGNYRLSPPKAA